jgi:nucleotide-binding universal stress UspA family protein
MVDGARPTGTIARMIHEILVPVDLSAHASAALGYALALREGERPIARDARVTVLHALDVDSPDLGAASEVLDLHASLRRHVAGDLATFVGRHPGADFRCEHRLVAGSAIGAIDRLTAEIKPHLVILGTHGRTGLARNLLGSVAETVVRRSAAPVLCVKALPDRHAPHPQKMRKVLFATDGSAHSRAALPFAIAFCRHYATGLAVLRVAREGEEAAKLRKQGALVPKKALERPPAVHLRTGVKVVVPPGPAPAVEWIVHTGPLEQWIAAAAEDVGADLICLATHGPHSFPRSLLAGTVENVVRLANVPVLVVCPAFAARKRGGAEAAAAPAAGEGADEYEETDILPPEDAPAATGDGEGQVREQDKG